ncbi:DUF6265 family protein [Adhaeribacter soli]|uniref:DUF6265 domain-containing protein n=1 Tax=Adhaeribacter soli TaxID=2607655 RepID=A0A5N1IJP1_9BACT|nr:DUF6265 family protein [Adhaeribacter soli]KAA9325963.1 hypothetical protein F0P94_16190 [Adhaeribacter soli]
MLKNRLPFGFRTFGFYFWVLLFLPLLLSCNTGAKKAEAQLKQLHWLTGTWQQQSEAGLLTETWQVKNASQMTGKSYLVDQHDTIFSEVISLEIQEGEVYYVPVIADQNDGKPVRFKLISGKDQTFVFENKTHDFPQRIIYHQTGSNQLTARIEGEIKGKLRSEEFKMQRVN